MGPIDISATIKEDNHEQTVFRYSVTTAKTIILNNFLFQNTHTICSVILAYSVQNKMDYNVSTATQYSVKSKSKSISKPQ